MRSTHTETLRTALSTATSPPGRSSSPQVYTPGVTDVLTKDMVSGALDFWRETWKLRVCPGEYGARAEARKAERRARAAAARRKAEEKNAFPNEC